MQLNKLFAFRQAVYACFTRAADALFELLDARLCSPRLTCFPELSCAPVFRRQWPSVYEALQDGQVNAKQLLDECVKQLPPTERPLLVGDHTAWARPHARTLQDRSFQHQPTPIKGQKPITIGHGYSTLGMVPETAGSGSWFLPLLHERIPSETTPSEKAAAQLKQVTALLWERPLALYDSEYGSGTFLTQTAQIACDLLFRVRPNRALYWPPPPYPGNGRPAQHGTVFRLADPSTWPTPTEEWEEVDEKLGRVKIKRWDGLHFKPAQERTLTLLQVERLEARGTRRDPKVIWLGYCGAAPLPRGSALWREYLSRFVIEHWYRFIKQSLDWTLPQLSTAEQGELWSVLMVIASWQLWLARGAAQDQPRQWQKPQPSEKMTPGRVHQGMGGVLAGMSTPALAPKPRGKSPGWPTGRVRTKRIRHSVIKKQSVKAKKAAPTTSQTPS
ncbi:MAG: NF041680 family putative transposase [Burkholderiales bacterium]